MLAKQLIYLAQTLMLAFQFGVWHWRWQNRKQKKLNNRPVRYQIENICKINDLQFYICGHWAPDEYISQRSGWIRAGGRAEFMLYAAGRIEWIMVAYDGHGIQLSHLDKWVTRLDDADDKAVR